MRNPLKEIIEILSRYNKEQKDVLWVGDKDKYTTWSEFEIKSNRDYDDEFGGGEVYQELIIAGYDWWIERRGYWWRFNSIPSRPKTKGNIEDILCGFDNEDFWSN